MLVKLENAKKSYDSFTLSCSLCLREGQITGVVGQNGAGKSTMFKALLDLIKLDSGEIQVLGSHPENMAAEEKNRIGAVLSDSGFGGHMTIKQIASVMGNAYRSFEKQEFLNHCQEFRLPIDKKIKAFSTGMKAKLKILLAISHHADLLVLDEPTAGLDVMARDEILDMLRDYMETEGRGILISSHISSDLEGFCDDIYVLHEGRTVLHEDTDVILSDYGFLKVSEEQYDALDKKYVLCKKKEPYGYSCLTKERQFYQENAPSIIVEKCGIDQVQKMLITGEQR